MDAASVLDDLLEISSHVEAAAILAGDELEAASVGGERLEGPARDLLAEAERVGGAGRVPTRVAASLREGSLLVLREGTRVVVARTRPRPPAGLVFHDLATCLRRLEEPARA